MSVSAYLPSSYILLLVLLQSSKDNIGTECRKHVFIITGPHDDQSNDCSVPKQVLIGGTCGDWRVPVYVSVEVWCQMSGVLAVVVLGLTLSADRTSISPEVEAFLHR